MTPRTILVGLCAAALAGGAGAAPQGARGYHVYVTNEDSGDLTIIDGPSGRTVATVPLGKRPRGVRVSPDGRTLYIALSGSPRAGPGVDEDKLPPADKAADGIGVFDVASRRLARVLRGVSDPEQLAIGPGGKLYIASEDTGTAVILDAGGRLKAAVPVGGEPEGVTASPDGRFVYMTSEEDAAVAVIDTAADKVVAHIAVGKRPRNIAFSPDGRRAYVPGETDASVTEIDARAHAALRRVTLPGPEMRPMGAAISRDGRTLYLTTGRGGQLVALDAAAMTVRAVLKVGERPWGLALSPDGRLAYTANGPSNDVSVVDLVQMKVVATLKAGDRPWGVAVGP